ncbi:UGSC family (seleno)protein [Chelativorans alearense]|uniref:UGSC family (seleno)protein n=1 Tax=Chelativorans alearense TaxID=2681495 RepID=UPI0013D3725D|nr:hypothetical protein [Chelativorans alearense]
MGYSTGRPSEPRYEVVWPLSPRTVSGDNAAARPIDLSGKTICELWDMNFRGEVMYPLFREHLKNRFHGVKIVDYSVFGNFHGPRGQAVIDALPGKLKELGCDAAIVGIGACGGCTPAVMRVAAMIEKLGIATVSVVATGFLAQAEIVARGLGLPLKIVEYPGHPSVDSVELVTEKVNETTAPELVEAFTARLDASRQVEPAEPEPGSVVFTGSFDEVQDHFDANLWSDGLPIVPPTPERVNGFLSFADRAPTDSFGTVPVEGREATIHSIAVTGVMAGCRPEYMPVLVAIVEAMCDPTFRINSCGTTPGWEPLVTVSGPIADQLGLHSGQGVMRVGRRANSSIGRFVRLYLRNICGYRIPPGAGDKASIGQSFLVALAEDEESARDIGWPTHAEDRGYDAGENVVTVRSVVAISPAIYSSGDRPEDHVRDWMQVMVRTFSSWVPLDFKHGVGHYLLVLSPLVASVVAREWSKDDIRQYLWNNAGITAGTAEHFGQATGNRQFNLKTLVKQGVLPAKYLDSDDPDRIVDFFLTPDAVEFIIAGDPDRNQSRAYMCNHNQGAPVSKPVRLPRDWDRRLSESRPAAVSHA